MLRLTCLLLTAFALHAQTSDPKLTFEVASVKVSKAVQPGGMPGFGRSSGGPGTDSPGQFAVTGISLKNLLFQRAFQLKPFEYVAPSWMDKEYYDVVAKVPPNTTRAQFQVMLQNLVIERFQIQFHKEAREIAGFDLTVAKGGTKMQKSPIGDSVPSVGPGPGGTVHVEKDDDGFFKIPAGPNPMTFATVANGQATLVTNRYSMQQLADMLSRNLNKQIYDKTELLGNYAFSFHYLPETASSPSTVSSASGDAPPSAALNVEAAPTVFTALQSQLGLRLERHTAPVDVMVIDHAEKVPIEN
jgi:uncharacterized protein (TIGR03435 family)